MLRKRHYDSYSGIDQDWESISAKVRLRDNYTCVEPGCNKYLGKYGGHIHHIQRLSDRGRTQMSNLILLCSEHHTKRHSHMISRPRRPRGKF